MTDHQPDPYREYIGSQIERFEPVIHAPARRGRRSKQTYRKVKSGMNPIEAIDHAMDRDRVAVFRDSVRLVMLCGDEQARAMPVHAVIHQAAGLTACVGPQLAVETATSLGISDARARYLVEQMLAEDRVLEGMRGQGEL